MLWLIFHDLQLLNASGMTKSLWMSLCNALGTLCNLSPGRAYPFVALTAIGVRACHCRAVCFSFQFCPSHLCPQLTDAMGLFRAISSSSPSVPVPLHCSASLLSFLTEGFPILTFLAIYPAALILVLPYKLRP